MAKLVPVSDLTAHPRLGGTDLLPALSAEEFDNLVESVRKDGIQQPLLVAWPERIILDGHHRWRAAQELGLTEVPVVTEETRSEDARLLLGLTLNVARRQLSGEQKRAAIAALLKSDPKQSDRSVASTVGASPTTVGAVRSEMEQAGDVSKMDTRTDSLGREQPAARPKYKPVSTRAKKPAKAPKPSKVDALREQREREYEERQAEAEQESIPSSPAAVDGRSGIAPVGQSPASTDAAIDGGAEREPAGGSNEGESGEVHGRVEVGTETAHGPAPDSPVALLASDVIDALMLVPTIGSEQAVEIARRLSAGDIENVRRVAASCQRIMTAYARRNVEAA